MGEPPIPRQPINQPIRPEVVAAWAPLHTRLLWAWHAPDGWTYTGTSRLSWELTRRLWHERHGSWPPADPPTTLRSLASADRQGEHRLGRAARRTARRAASQLPPACRDIC